MVISVKRVTKIILSTIILAVVVFTVCAILAIQNQALVKAKDKSSTEEVVAGTELLRRVKRMLTETGGSQNYIANIDEINSVFVLANKRFDALHGNAEVFGDALHLKGTWKLPLGDSFFINAHSSIPQGNVFVWRDTQVGNLPIPDGFANWLFKRLGTKLVHSQFSSWVDDGVKAVNVNGDHILVEAILPNDLPGSMQNTIGILGGISSEEQAELVGQANYYLEKLSQSHLTLGSERDAFSAYLNVLSQAILNRVQSEGLNFKDELTAAIFSLAYAMEPSIMQPFLPSVGHSFRLPSVELGSRQDFAKHFILSAVLEILSNKEVAFTIGELKELRDSRGGSGYSLKDIAADRAGIYFIRALTNYEIVAQRFVNPRYSLSDYHYFPSVSGLKEGLSEAEFKRDYSSTKSPEYLSLINEIDRRISTLPLYNLR